MLFPELPDKVLLVSELRAYFADPTLVRTVLLPLVAQTHRVSLRTFEWCCVNYAKRCNLVCRRLDGGYCNVYREYRRVLAVYHREAFDPFRRHSRTTLVVDGVVHATTLAQVHWVAWAHRNGVLRFVEENAARIEADQHTHTSAHRVRTREVQRLGLRRKRRAFTQPRDVPCSVYARTVDVAFE
jgi:hypothetical protein